METIMGLKITPRNIHAGEVQNILTKHGCIIKARLGFHEVSDDACSPNGLIILHIQGKDDEIKDLKNDLSKIDGVTVNYMQI